jgi:hypothetical protein
VKALPDWAIDGRELPDGRLLFVVPLLFDRARLTVGRDEHQYDDGW